MVKGDLFRQCKLHSPPDRFTYTWLPTKIAVCGKELIFCGQPGWVVVEAYMNFTKTKKEIFVLGDSHRRQREVSDI